MNSDDFFKHFFGYGKGRRSNPLFDEDKHHDDFMDQFDELHPNSDIPDIEGDIPDMEGEFWRGSSDFKIPEPRDMFQHFEEILRNFGMTEFPFAGKDFPSIEQTPATPRDEMLKTPDSTTPELRQPNEYDAREQPYIKPPIKENPFDGPSWFDKFVGIPDRSRTYRPEPKQDFDLDKQIEEGNLDSVLSDAKQDDASVTPRSRSSRPRSFFKSTSVVTVRGPDGKIEQKRTTKDGSGKEETTVTRSYGDQSHTVVTKADDKGNKERIESFDNMDEKDLEHFEKRWSSSEKRPNSSVQDDLFKMPVLPYQDHINDKGFLRRLFEFSFPGFSKPDK